MTDSAAPAGRSFAESPDFEDLIRAAAQYYEMLPALVRKDYWVTRVLRAIATDPVMHERVIFKGGTSLSKGWHLIDRFSEDIDLLLTGAGFGAMPSKGERERYLKSLRPRIESSTPLRLPDLTATPAVDHIFYYARDDKHLNVRFGLPGYRIARDSASTDWLLVEAGYRGGSNPHATLQLTSMVAEFSRTQPAALAALEPYASDLVPFTMELLKPERTMAEKLVGLHVDMLDGTEGARRVRTRHYSDVVQLFDKSADVAACLARGSFAALLREAGAISNRYWGTNLDLECLNLVDSPALNPTEAQIRILTASYENPLERALYFRNWKPFSYVLDRLRALAQALTVTP